ncbi:MAG: hypothetical protein N2745_11255 [Syntrophorhabdaceae bacterium]|nr:hypothetical protein [Syntrophorhabdaceae bacterium]
MYQRICRLILNNAPQLIYTTNSSMGHTLTQLKEGYPSFYHEISINEKVAFETAYAGAITGKKTMCILSTEGLYKTLDPVMSSAYTGITGGYVVLCLKETEEEITPIGYFSKLPLLITEDMANLSKIIEYGYFISDKYATPVLIQAEMGENDWFFEEKNGLRSEGSSNKKPEKDPRKAEFIKNPGRWAATPKYRLELHRLLNEKIEAIREEFETYPGNTLMIKDRSGVITCKREYLEFYGEDTSLLYLTTIHPIPLKLVNAFMDRMDEVYILEGEYPVIEMQLGNKTKIRPSYHRETQKREKPYEVMYGFFVARDILGPASSINIAHGIKKREPGRKVLAITYENHFLHSGLPAFINTLYNGSNYVLMVMTSEKEDEIKAIITGWGFTNFFTIDNVAEVERFLNHDKMTVLFCKGII